MLAQEGEAREKHEEHHLCTRARENLSRLKKFSSSLHSNGNRATAWKA